MKKTLIKILACVLVLSVLVACVAGCKKDKWEGTSMTEWGEVVSASNGGFIAETEKYYYFINGIANSTDDNTFGAPLKGALMAADKTDLSKTQVVVPKLFAATDYNSGLFLDGDYVYYGTPNVEKDGSGAVANSELTFMRTKLDGTDTTEYFTLSSLSVEYRFVAANETVYIVYYDTEETALVCYNTADGNETVIAKTDATTEKMVSLNAYKFIPAKNLANGVAVLYTTSVYSEAYIESKAEQSGYSRATESYNEVYLYTVGDEVNQDTALAGKKVLGNEKSTFAITMIENGVVYYTETLENGTVENYGITIADLKDGKEATKIVNSSYVAETNIVDLANNVAYTLAEGKVYRSSLTGDDKADKTLVANNSNITTLLFVLNDELYYVNSTTQIAKIKLRVADAKEVRVSGDVVSTAWYEAEIVGDKLFYLDASANGASYVHYVSITAEPSGDDESGYYIDGATLLGKMTEADVTSVITAKINNVANELENGVLPFETVEGVLTVKSVADARTAYDALNEESKALIADETLATLANYEKAVEMANKYAKLDGMYGYTNLNEEGKTALKTAYDEVKTAIEEFRASENYSTISAYIENNLKANYDLAVDQFEEE